MRLRHITIVCVIVLAALISQAISRCLARHNFYDALLEQDGHAVERLSPPRDLREWQNQPVSHLANPKPVVADSLESNQLQNLLQNHPYGQFPVAIDGQIRGCFRRKKPPEPS